MNQRDIVYRVVVPPPRGDHDRFATAQRVARALGVSEATIEEAWSRELDAIASGLSRAEAEDAASALDPVAACFARIERDTGRPAGGAGWGALFEDWEPAPLVEPKRAPLAPGGSATPASMQANPSPLAFGAERAAPAAPPPAGRLAPPKLTEVERGEAVERSEASGSSFDGSILSAALVPDRSARPPYEPESKYARPPHAPGAARVLSVIAPGAGQVYNGDDDRALGYGLRFWMIRPWIESVREARQKAERIATYWEPPPAPGVARRVTRYVALWYAGVVCALTVLGFSASVALSALGVISEEPEAPRRSAVVRSATEIAIGGARARLLEAEIAALGASVAERERQIALANRIEPAERVRRLFAIGLEACRGGQLALCEATMRRVAKLDAAHPHALTLQAWASSRQRGGSEPMPSVSQPPASR